MAYYFNSSYYQRTNDLGEYHQTSYGDFSNDSLDSLAYSSYKDPSIYNLFDYNPTPYHHAVAYNHSYDRQHVPSWSTTCYSTFTPTESKSIMYEPNSHHLISYDQNPQTQFVISYSVSEFNVPEFDDYDPTPYDGGYDIAKTYGKPLPPSDQICYPRSTAGITRAPTLDNKAQEKEKEKTHDHHGQAEKPKEEISKPKAAAKEEEEKKKGHDEENSIIVQPTEDQTGGGNGYEYGNQVSQIPSGYGLEAMDLCESIFGYWPSLNRFYASRPNHNACCGYGHERNGASEYLFGSSDPYVERRDGGGSFGQPIHYYERRYREQPLHKQVEYDQEEYSWSQNFNIF